MQHEIDLMRRMQVLTRDLEVQPDWSVQGAFRTIDTFGEGKLNVQNLAEFMGRNGSYINAKEALAFIRRIDTDGDAKLNF